MRFEGVLQKSQSVGVLLTATELRVGNLKFFCHTFLLDMSEVRFGMENVSVILCSSHLVTFKHFERKESGILETRSIRLIESMQLR